MTTTNTANNIPANTPDNNHGNTTASWNIKRLLDWTTAYLEQADIDAARLSAEILLAHTLNMQRIDLYVKYDYCPTQAELAQYRQLVKRCKAYEPVAYLTGKAHFFSMELTITPDVLIPRPETEILVTQAIDFLRSQINRPAPAVLDMCTGSGCIALAIATNVIEANVTATDISEQALNIARKNIEKHNLQQRIKLLQSDLFANLHQVEPGVFDLLITNPPYIPEHKYQQLPDNIRCYEPPDALLAGPDGLLYYRRIIEQAKPFLADNAAIMLEIEYDQAKAVTQLCQQAGYLKDIKTVKDNLGHNRVVIACNIQ